MSTITATSGTTKGMTKDERFVIFASSLGTVFEWYDFYLYGSLASIIGAQFFSAYPPATRDIFALLAFAAGFLVRPFGAIVFGRVGDIVGRKYTFLVTILIMGISTFIVGLLPNAATIGIAAPIILIGLRLLQGLALGGEYGGAATYVAEHAPPGKRGYYTSFIQTTATLGLFLSLLVILFTRTILGEADFAAWGWRIPFLLSVVLLGVSVVIRLKLNEFPVFQKMKDEGKGSKAPLTEAFANWSNGKLVLIALIGGVMGQGVVWYTGQFYALFFLQSILQVDGYTANLLIAWSLLLGTGFFIVFGALSDKIGRKPIILAWLPYRSADLLPDLPHDLDQRQPDAGKGHRIGEGGSRGRSEGLRRPVQPGRHTRVQRTLRSGSRLPRQVFGQVRDRRGSGRIAHAHPHQRQGRSLHQAG